MCVFLPYMAQIISMLLFFFECLLTSFALALVLDSDLQDVICRCFITVSELGGDPSPSFSPLHYCCLFRNKPGKFLERLFSSHQPHVEERVI